MANAEKRMLVASKNGDTSIGMAGDSREIDGLFLVATTSGAAVVVEKIDRGFADSLLASKAAQAMATN